MKAVLELPSHIHADRNLENPFASTQIIASRISEEQDHVFTLLRNAMHACDLLSELCSIKNATMARSVTQHSTAPDFPNLEANVRLEIINKFDAFSVVFSALTEEELAVLDGMDLINLYTHQFWFELLNDTPGADASLMSFMLAYNRLVSIYNYQPLTTEDEVEEHWFVDNSSINDSPTSDETNTLLHRNIASRSLFTGILISGLCILFLASLKPSFLEALHLWTAAAGTYFESLTVLLLLMLTVSCFQMITHIVHPASKQIAAEDKDQSSLLNNVFSFKASRMRLLAGCIGPVLLGFGTGISATAGLGAFGVTVMLDGIYQTYGVPFWLSQLVLSIACYIIAWRWAKISLGVGTIPALLLIGPAISFGATVAPHDLTFAGDLIAFVTGTIVFSIGIAMSAAADLGPDGKTALVLAAEKCNKWPIPRSAFYFNLSAIFIGLSLGGNFGVGTVLNLMAVPTLLHYLIPPMRRYLST